MVMVMATMMVMVMVMMKRRKTVTNIIKKKREIINANLKKYPTKTPTFKHNKKYEDEEEEIEIEQGDGVNNDNQLIDNDESKHNLYIYQNNLLSSPTPQEMTPPTPPLPPPNTKMPNSSTIFKTFNYTSFI